jgi:tripartite-type tricarboxylate transporter receptor subunit TctC
VHSGKLRAIAITDDVRMKVLPEVPTVGESGLPQLRASTWSGLVAPAGTPRQVIATLNAAVNAELKGETLRAALAKFAIEPDPITPEAFSAFIASEVKKYADVVKAVGIEPR